MTASFTVVELSHVCPQINTSLKIAFYGRSCYNRCPQDHSFCHDDKQTGSKTKHFSSLHCSGWKLTRFWTHKHNPRTRQIKWNGSRQKPAVKSKTGERIRNGTGRGAEVRRSGRQNKRLGELRREHNRQSWQAWVKMSRRTVHTPPQIKESGNRWAGKVKWWMRWERGHSRAAGVTTGELVKAEPTGMNELA